jgi:hypothetical protein
VVLVAQTREEIVATHARLKQASDDIGLGEQAYGDVFKVAGQARPVADRPLRAA